MSTVMEYFSRTVIRAFLLPIAFLALDSTGARAAAATTTTALAITSASGAVTSVPTDTAVTLTATVKAGSALVQAGSVKFCDATAAHCTDIHLIGSGQLTTSGTVALKLILGPGTHSYKAEFTGTPADAASASAASSLAVNSAPATTTIAQSGSAGNYTLKATVAGKGSATGPTGKVSFLDTSNQNAVLATATLGASTEAFSWSTPQSPSTSADPQSIVVADFNADGIPDLAVGSNGTTATKGIGSIDILLGKGDGTFLASKAYTGLSGTHLILATSFVTGGPLDIIAVNNSAATTNNGLLFRGDGKGGLGTGTTLSLGIDTVTALIAGDFNGDGKQDFIVAGEAFGVPAFNVFLGNGNGTFNAGTLNATTDVAITGLGAGDFTGAGALDLAVVHSDGTVDIFLQDGAGDFYPNAGTNAGSSPTAIAIGDFNGDGKADLAITNSARDNVSILLGNGSGGFTAAASPTTGSLPKSIAVGDFNADGIADLAIGNSGAATVTILLGKGDGTFTAEPVLDTGNTPVSVAIGRFNGENTADIAVANEDPSSGSSAGTATILLSQRTETATASASGIAPASAGTHLVDASYAGDTIYHSSVSGTTSLSGSGKQAAAPILSPAAGTYSAAQTVTITDGTSGATIYYTINGTTPTSASTKYTASIKVASTETIEAIAIASGYSQSIVASAKYTIETATATPTFSPAAGTYSSAQSVKLTSATTGATIYYTVNGTTPTTSSTKYTTVITVSASETIKAIAVATGHTNSTAASAAYVIETATATPTFSPAAGTYSSAQSIKLTSATTGATIYYTVNGTTPTTSSTKYTTAITVSASETIKAIAVATGHTNSTATSAAYVIETATATPTFSPAAGTYSSAQSVKLTSATTGATIYYTVNGTTPTTSSTKYTTAITVSASETIKAIAVATGHNNSTATSAAYTINSSAGATTATPTALSYPFTNINTSSKTQTVTFKNTSTTAITSLSTALTGTGVTSYSKTQTCGTTLAAGASCTVTVIFTPKTDGTLSATLQLTGKGASTAVSLTGVCADPTSIAPDANTYVFDTTEGNIYVELRPDVAPKNVANFLYYVNNGTYTSSIVHRVVPGFINQGGGYKLNSAGQIVAPTTASPVVNEFKLSNVRGTIAMAKVSNDPNSATDQFFFNTTDNSSSLDNQDGGYTVIGTIVGVQGVNIGSASEGLAVMDAINAVPVFQFQSPFTSIPLIDYTSGEGVVPSNYVYTKSVSHYTAKNNGPATPIFSISGGTYSGPQTIKLTESTANATIYYFLFDSGASTVTKYTGPFTVSSSQYVVAYATAPGYSSESYNNYEYYTIK